MRGQIDRQQSMFVALNLEDCVQADHRLRQIKRWADQGLATMRHDFDAAYSHLGQPSVPPEQLLKALLHSIPSEIKLMEAIEYNLRYRWFVDLPVEQRAGTPAARARTRAPRTSQSSDD